MNQLNPQITVQNNRLMVAGDLNFSTVMPLWQQSLPLLAKQIQLDFDLSNVVSSNSAGLALLIEWIKLAKRTNKQIAFHSLPAQLESIMRIVDLEEVALKALSPSAVKK